MNLLKKKEIPEEYKKCIDQKEALEHLLNENEYISRKQYVSLLENENVKYYRNLLQEELIKPYCRKKGIPLKKMKDLISFVERLEEHINSHNEKYYEDSIKINGKYFKHILDPIDKKITLDIDQLKVVLCDEDYSLVVAGAGAGKTTTIAAKVRYLVEKKNVDPSKILIVSFTNKAVNELKEKIQQDLSISCPIATFHSTGYAILRKEVDKKFKIVDTGFLYQTIETYFQEKIMNNPDLLHQLILFFTIYFEGIAHSDELLKKITYYSTIKSDLHEYSKEIIDSRSHKKITIQNEIVRSSQELEIANYLYMHNIDYEYEAIYPYYIPNISKPYTPDFRISQNGKVAYIEHFGISEEGKNDSYDEYTLEYYKKCINDKVLLHRKHGTDLVYTFSSYKDGKSYLKHLEEQLIKHGFVLQKKEEKEILKKIHKMESGKYNQKLVQLICRFISNFKVNGYKLEDFDRMREESNNVRTKLFLSICKACYLEYEKVLLEKEAIDFQDMINESYRMIKECENLKKKLDFDYIIVDEYQDISKQRFDLTKALSNITDAKIMAVGDDWQSIYAFSGSDITFFTEFEKKMGYAKLLKITHTYRNSQEVIDIAGNFIQKNHSQITKSLVSNKTIDNPVLIYTYDSHSKQKGKIDTLSQTLGMILQEIKKETRKKQSILLLGRFGFEGYQLGNTEDFEYDKKTGKVLYKKYPKLDITFMTAHSSKGLGYDQVVILNGKDDTYGFPSKIEDDPVLKFVVKQDYSYDYAEERRLFYVALTRTKNRVYIISPENNPSAFLLEIKQDYKNVVLKGNWSSSQITNYIKKPCPYCGYPMQYRYKSAYGLRLFMCTNEPEICDFMTNEYKAGKLPILKCPDCKDGYLIVKKGNKDQFFLGCTNYKPNGKGCNHKMSDSQYYHLYK